MYNFFCLTGYIFFLLKFVVTVFVSLSYDLASVSVVPSHIITEIFTIFATTCSCIPNIIFFTYMMFFTLAETFIIIPLLIWITVLPSNLYLHLQDICSVKFFDLFIPVIMLSMLKFKLSVLFGYFIRHAIKSITTSKTTIQINHKWIVM